MNTENFEISTSITLLFSNDLLFIVELYIHQFIEA